MNKRLLAAFLTLFFSVAPAADDDGAPAQLSPEDIPACIERAEVGDWVLYRLNDGGSLRVTVVERWEEQGETYLVLRREQLKKRRKKGPITEEKIAVSESVENLRALAPGDYVIPGEVLVRGRKVAAAVIHFVEEGRVVRQSYISEEVPVFGLARGVNVDGEKREVAMYALDYGQATDGEE